MRASLADEVTECFAGFAIGGGDYVVELLPPEGREGPQCLRLRPQRQGYEVIVAGSVNPLEKFAELRTFEHVAIAHEMRFGKRSEIAKPEWEQLLRKAEDLLRLASIESARVGPSPSLLANARRKKQGRRIPSSVVAAFVVVLVLATFVVVRVIQTVLAGRAG